MDWNQAAWSLSRCATDCMCANFLRVFCSSPRGKMNTKSVSWAVDLKGFFLYILSVPCINNLAYGATSCSRTLTSYVRTLLIPSWRECSSSPSTLPLNPCVVSRHKANHAFSHCLISPVSNQEKLPFFHHAGPLTRALCERFTCQEWVDLGQPFSRSLTPEM